MPSVDAIFLARLQFAFTIGFHIVLPAFSIGLASYLMVLEALWLKTGRQVYLDLFQYWVKAFSLVFAMGVVSGLVMSYQFGTNWSEFAKRAGPIVGPLMGYEVLTAFFLEAGFLGVMLFGMKRVGRGLHMFATCMVAGRHADQRVLDPCRQLLDADAAGLHDGAGRPLPSGRLVGDHLQPVVLRAAAAHGAGELPQRRFLRRRGRGMASAARSRQTTPRG